MPRVTRTALRTAAILDDEAHLAAATPLPSTPTVSRTPLGEVAGNLNGDAVSGAEQGDAVKPGKKAAGKGRKAKGTRKGRKKNEVDSENEVEILEDPYQSSASSAAGEACEELLTGKAGETYRDPVHDSRPRTPPSKAVLAALEQLSPRSHTPRFDPEVHKTPKTEENSGVGVEDSFVNNIGTRTPAAVAHSPTLGEEILEKSTIEEEGTADKDDSFVGDIVTRSPVRTNMRIEDTVEAIDALEEAIEQITESIPIIIDDRLSPVKVHHAEKKSPKPVASDQDATPTLLTTKKSPAASSKVKRTAAAKKPTPETQRKAPIKRSAFKTSNTSRLSSTPRTTAAKHSTANNTALAPKPAKPTTDTTPTVTTTPAVNTTTLQKKHTRVSSISKPPFVPQRSTKAPTRPTFTLPGDAISQKLKAQRASRLAREEAEDQASKKRDFKAQPVRVSLAPVVRGTAASRARMSLVRGGEGSNDGASAARRKEEGTPSQPATTAAARTSSVASSGAQLTATTKRASIAPPPNGPSYVRANTSAPRGAPSLAGPATSKGKEVFGRALAEQEARDAARREKEDAARKARAEAAERGRVASREWARKMRARKVGGGRGSGGGVVVGV
ncbi:hypothetical protein MMC26_003190 [Xylographa opegraphella]|nr:hypothetical protein [Xylographa opegraphella]